MAARYSSDLETLRAQIAAIAARLIAEDGADYNSAKRKAAKHILGNDARAHGKYLPNNAQIEQQVRTYNQIFLAHSQPARLIHLRKLALQLMLKLQDFAPYLTGAALNGTAGAHSGIHLHLFHNIPKDVEIYLLNRHIDFRVWETPHANRLAPPVETLNFTWQGEQVYLDLYGQQDMRSTPSGSQPIERANIPTVQKLITEDSAK